MRNHGEVNITFDYIRKAREAFEKEGIKEEVYTTGSHLPGDMKAETWMHQTIDNPEPLYLRLLESKGSPHTIFLQAGCRPKKQYDKLL